MASLSTCHLELVVWDGNLVKHVNAVFYAILELVFEVFRYNCRNRNVVFKLIVSCSSVVDVTEIDRILEIL